MLYPLSYEGGDSKGSRLDSSLDRLRRANSAVAKGPQAANVLDTTDQTDLFHTMARAMGLE